MTTNFGASWVRIVIVNYNGGELLQCCIDALAVQSMPTFEAVIVDNASTAPSVAGLRLPDGRFQIHHAGDNIGFAAGCNLGADGSRTPWIATLNPDAIPRPDWLAELHRATERYPWARMFGSTQIDANDPSLVDGFGDLLAAFGTAWRSRGGLLVNELPDSDREPFSPCAAAALYARSAFEAVGGFDQRFFCYLEDVDLAFRLRLRGETCVQVRRAEVWHVGSAIAGRLSDFSVFHSYRNRIWLFVKNVPPLLLPLLSLLQAAVMVAALARPRAQPYRHAALRGVWAGLKGLPKALADRRRVQRQRTVSSSDVARMMIWSPLRRQSRMPPPISR
jgi:N-acetylglucosaminyl-diphospho-decaprenol L-rhamnosyltransferase